MAGGRAEGCICSFPRMEFGSILWPLGFRPRRVMMTYEWILDRTRRTEQASGGFGLAAGVIRKVPEIPTLDDFNS